MILGVDIWPCLVGWAFSVLVSAALSGSQGNAVAAGFNGRECFWGLEGGGQRLQESAKWG